MTGGHHGYPLQSEKGLETSTGTFGGGPHKEGYVAVLVCEGIGEAGICVCAHIYIYI